VARNFVSQVADDACEFDGGCAVNFRFYSNTLRRFNNGLSLAPIWRGPLWDIGNIFSYPSSGGGAWKLGSGGGSRTTGWGYHIHDTNYSPAGVNCAGLYSIGGYKRQVFMNDLMTGGSTSYPAVRQYATDAADTVGKGTNESNYCVLHTWNNPNSPVVWPPGGTSYDSTQTKLAAVNWQNNGFFCNPRMADTTAAAGNYLPSGVGRNKGRRIAGVNDRNQFFIVGEGAPDMGALEYPWMPAAATVIEMRGGATRQRTRVR